MPEMDQSKQENCKDTSTMAEMKQSNRDHCQDKRFGLEQKEKELESLQHRLEEMEAKYNQTRTALEEKDEELRSFKDRVAGDIALSIKTGKTERMNNPVCKGRLKEMYDELRQQWPGIKHHLKSSETDRETVQTLIRMKFEDAKHYMEQKKEDIDKVFELEPSSEPTSQKVKECRQSTIQNFQLSLYYKMKDSSCSKTFHSEDTGRKPQDVLEYLSWNCYWLGCLLALNNPPLQPDWENHDPGMDSWNMIPRNIQAASIMQ